MIGEQEKKMVQGLFSFFSEKPVVIDCGSNKGGWSDIILEEFGDNCEMFLFEPVDKMRSFTEVKYEYRPNVCHYPFAVSKDEGVTNFYYFNNYNNELSSIYPDLENWKNLPMESKLVSTVSLDHFWRDELAEIDCIKMDLEGGERDAVIGCMDLLKNDRIKFLIVEYSEHYKRAKASFLDILNTVNMYGYKAYSYDGNYNEVTLQSFIEDYHAENYIITKENIRNYSEGWNSVFIENTKELGRFELVIEIGCMEGLTTKYICENLLEVGGRVVAVDAFEDYYIKGDTEHGDMFKQQYQRFLRNTKGLPIEIRKGKSEIILPQLHQLRAGFVYVDGDHRKMPVYSDCSWAFALTRIGGYILIDDYDFWSQDTKDGVDLFLNEFSGAYEVESNGYQILIKKKIDRYNDLTYKYYL
jgi:FkbM family methyltransferase